MTLRLIDTAIELLRQSADAYTNDSPRPIRAILSGGESQAVIDRINALQAERDALRAEVEALKAQVNTLQFALREIATGPFTARGMRVIALNNCGPLTRYPVNDATHTPGGGLTPLSADDNAAHDPDEG